MSEGRTMHDSMDGGGRAKQETRTDEQLSRMQGGATKPTDTMADTASGTSSF